MGGKEIRRAVEVEREAAIDLGLCYIESNFCYIKSRVRSPAIHERGILAKFFVSDENHEHQKIRFEGLRRVYDVPSWSRIVPKGTLPRGPQTLTFPNPNH